MKAIVFIEERQGEPLADALAIISHLAADGHAVSAFFATSASGSFSEAMARCGAERIFLANDARFSEYPLEPCAELLAQLCRDHAFDTIILASTVLGSDIAGKLAAILDAGIGWGISELVEDNGILVGRRLTLWESLVVEMEWISGIRIALMRPNSCGKIPAAPPDCAFTKVDAKNFTGVRRAGAAESNAVSGLAKAKTIVAGGRGIGKPENLDLVRDLAEALNGAVGVSLPVVEAGWAPRSMHVGQTGTIIQSNLYVACGISGQFQHKIGIERAGTIIAINSDLNAPIMGFCDMAVIADLTTLLPRLTALIKGKQFEQSSPS